MLSMYYPHTVTAMMTTGMTLRG